MISRIRLLPQSMNPRLVGPDNELYVFGSEPHDLAASKLVTFREKDREFVRVLIVENLIKPVTLRRRLGAPGQPASNGTTAASDGRIDPRRIE